MSDEIYDLKRKLREIYESIMYYRETGRPGPLSLLESQHWKLKKQIEELELKEKLAALDYMDLV